ncbi:hypothetical protein [Vibrio taketomensis]|uniref:hypothetical protein n=1 Tax=Vibrio taketomensis TaxID=2572923 RepID=UPI00138A3A8A|nr:hypothetical protein [Vibrio taketomensis]
MSCTKTHSHNEHAHGKDCGHTAIRHGDHIDYLVDGVLHHPHGDHCDEHVIEASEVNPNACNPVHTCQGHVHGPGCGHEAIQHGDHIDYIVDGRLHHQHGEHCDDHGPIEVA